MPYMEMRKHPRNPAVAGLPINDTRPYRGGTLHDMSASGAAVWYLPETPPTSKPLAVGQSIDLFIGDTAMMPCTIVRIFDHGFAAAFDCPAAVAS